MSPNVSELLHDLEAQRALTAELQSQLDRERQQAAELQSQLDERQQELDKRQQEFDERQQQFDEQRRVLDAVTDNYAELQQQNQAYRDELECLRRWVFGSRRERLQDAAGQQHLFELEPFVPPTEPEADAEDKADRKRPRRKRKPLDLSHLPHERIELDVSDEEKTCEGCGREKDCIGHDERETLHFQPAMFKVVVHVLPKFACRCCKDGVTSPPGPERILKRSIADATLISYVIVSKFFDHQPLYRQEDIFARFGLHLARSTLCDWLRGAADLLEPLYEHQKKLVLQSPILWTDDTPVTMLDRQTERGSREARFWVYIGDEAHPYSVYDFTDNHEGIGPTTFLAGFRGYLHADAYTGYDCLFLNPELGILEVACWAHVRRKFFEAKTSSPREAYQVLEWIQQLFDIEDRASAMTPDERQKLRECEANPVLDKIEAYLDVLKQKALPKSALAKAVTYARNQWSGLRRYTTDGRLTIDNNLSERTLRIQALGRKNWMFLGNEGAGQRACVFYTLLAGAKRHYIEPWVYLTDVLYALTSESPDLDALLPQNWAAAHPEHVLTHRVDEARARERRTKARRENRRENRRQANH